MNRFLTALTLATTLTLGACATSGPPAGPSTLSDYTWRLVAGPSSLTDADNVTLAFTKEGRVGIFGLCNRMGGEYIGSGATVKVSKIISTMMACVDDRKMKLEGEVGGALEGSHTTSLTRSEPPQLNLKLQNGQTWIFRGQR